MDTVTFKSLNVFWELPNNWCEEDYLKGVLEHADYLLSNLGLSKRFVFVVTSFSNRLPIRHPERVVVLQTSDEGHEIPTYIEDAFMIFKNYRPFDNSPGNLRVIPLGCNKDVPALSPRVVSERDLDVFFIGRSLIFRKQFFAATQRAFKDRPDLTTKIEEASGFRLGMSPEAYGECLVNTKIALSPRGVSHETFRTYEAMRAGCVVVAERQLPTWFTTGWPVIEVDDWFDIGNLVDDLIDDPVRLNDLSLNTFAWWREECSEEAVAHYIVRQLSLKL